MTRNPNSTFLLHTALGFLGILFIVLVAALFARLIYPRIATERDHPGHLIADVIQVEVLNGCGVPGIATRVTSHLRTHGFDVVSSGNFESFDVAYTLIVDRAGNIDQARRVARALGVSSEHIIREVSEDFYLDASVIIGSDYESLTLK